MLWLALLVAAVRAQVVFNPSVPLDISTLYNNRGFAMKPGDANLDDLGNAYPAQYPPPQNFIYNGINFTFPQYNSSGNDNVLALGQIVHVPQGRYFSVQMLASCETGLASSFINATYSDGSTSSSPVLVPAWRHYLTLLSYEHDNQLQSIHVLRDNQLD
jgi:alpha-L-fucosidase